MLRLEDLASVSGVSWAKILTLQRIKDRLGINAQPDRGDDQRADRHARQAVHRNFVNGWRGLPVHGTNDFEVIIKAAANSDHSNDDQRDLALQNCCVKNVK